METKELLHQIYQHRENIKQLEDLLRYVRYHDPVDSIYEESAHDLIKKLLREELIRQKDQCAILEETIENPSIEDSSLKEKSSIVQKGSIDEMTERTTKIWTWIGYIILALFLVSCAVIVACVNCH